MACRHQYRPAVFTPTTLSSFLESLVDAIGQGLHTQLCNSVGTTATGFHSSFLHPAYLIRHGPSLLSVVITPAKISVGRKGFTWFTAYSPVQELRSELGGKNWHSDRGEYCLLTGSLSGLCSAPCTAQALLPRDDTTCSVRGLFASVSS